MLGASRKSCGSVVNVILKTSAISRTVLRLPAQSLIQRPLTRSFHPSFPSRVATATAAIPDDVPAENSVVTRFEELSRHGLVCDTVVKTLTKTMGLETMTPVQSMTMNETLKGDDV